MACREALRGQFTGHVPTRCHRNQVKDVTRWIRFTRTSTQAPLAQQHQNQAVHVPTDRTAAPTLSSDANSDRTWRVAAFAPAVTAFVQSHLHIVHAVVCVYPWPFYIMMAFMPHAKLTHRILSSAKCLIPLAVLYGLLLFVSFTPDHLSTIMPGDLGDGVQAMMAGKPKMLFIPEVDAIGNLLSEPIASVSAWAHLQFISFFCARWIWLDGLVKKVTTFHSIVLCATLPPLGFFSHIVTCFLKRQMATSGGDGDTPAASESGTPPGAASASPGTSTPPDQQWMEATAGPGLASSQGLGSSAGYSRSASSGENGTNGAGKAADSNGASAAHKNGSDVGKSGNGANRSNGDSTEWLTVLEPEYVQRG